MKYIIFRQVLIFFISFISAFTLYAQSDIDSLNSSIVRLSPDAFTQLPVMIREDLKKRECTVPQLFQEMGSNVIHGHFYNAKQTDWAVLCSINGTSSILVYQNDRTDSVKSFASEKDDLFLQSMGMKPKIYAFSRNLEIADTSMIRKLYFYYDDGPELPPLNHVGINDQFYNKGSSIWYYHKGNWIELPGED
ncbi:MAG: hypothetical protein JJ895_08745 [Balneolaceae bacterium]|nr:hypothetical protein [Balneolaceae bacterium]